MATRNYDVHYRGKSNFTLNRNELQKALEETLNTPEIRCVWSQDEEGNWDTGCGDTFTLIDETTPGGNNMRYCPFCGGSLVEEFYKDPFADEG